MNFLDHFSGRFVESQRRRFPDHLMQGGGDAGWPVLDGVVAVFFTSRTGSTALSRLARMHFDLGEVGEAFNGPALTTRAERWGLDSLRDAAMRQVEAASPARWFMFKSGGPGAINAARMGFLADHATVLHPILLLRRDILGQALSVFAARHTRQYHSTQTPSAVLTDRDYDPAAIRQIIGVILGGNRRLGDLAQGFPRPPRLLLYEDFRDGDTAAPLAILGETGLPRRSTPLPPFEAVRRNTHPLNARFREWFMDAITPADRDLLAQHEAFVAAWQARCHEGAHGSASKAGG